MEETVDVGVQTPIGQVETDAFCPQCGYNLYTQIIARDERLKILVCRCPECGSFSAAGNWSSAGGKVMRRLTTLAVMGYVLFLIFMLTVGSMILGGFQNDAFNADIRQYTLVGTPELVADGITALLLGLFMANFMWHWSRKWRYFAMGLPLIVFALVWLADESDYTDTFSHFLSKARTLEWVIGIQVLILGLGLLTGRFVGRFALGILLPKGLRQHLAFLWIIDGKKLPPSPSLTPSGDGKEILARTAARRRFDT